MGRFTVQDLETEILANSLRQLIGMPECSLIIKQTDQFSVIGTVLSKTRAIQSKKQFGGLAFAYERAHPRTICQKRRSLTILHNMTAYQLYDLGVYDQWNDLSVNNL